MPIINSSSIITTKCKAEEELRDECPKKKKAKLSFISTQDSPVGIIWDAKNYSCAYDAMFSILCDVWIQNPKKWTKWFCWLSKPLERLAYNYRDVLDGKKNTGSSQK